jgi:hypothetical protein
MNNKKHEYGETPLGKKLWDNFRLKIDIYEKERASKYGMAGNTLIDAPKETDSRTKKFLNWHNDCVEQLVNGKAKNLEDKFNL